MWITINQYTDSWTIDELYISWHRVQPIELDLFNFKNILIPYF